MAYNERMDSKMPPVRVRFAPSPTGRTHLGSGRTALYDFLIARQTGGQFVLRIEDTDRKRYNPDSEAELIDSLHWLGLDWDEGPDVGGPYGPYRQSERKEIYQAHAYQLVKLGHAYPCFCTPERLARLRQEQIQRKEATHYDGTCLRMSSDEAEARVRQGEPHVVRFKVPDEGSIEVYDHLRGKIVVENRNIDDYIILKSDGHAVYHLAAMVDDHLMRITHVIRGSEWLPTFPLHAHIIRAFNWEEPVWVHLSVFLKPSGKGKMSKRDAAELMKDGFSIYITDLRDMGYLPEGVVNWIALMGWSYDDHTEFFTMHDLIKKFTLDRLNPAPAAINISKLDHFNGLHIRSLPTEELARRMAPFFEKAGYQADEAKLRQIAPLVRERIVTLEDAPEVGGLFFEKEIKVEAADLLADEITLEQALAVLQRALDILETLPEIKPELAEGPLRELVDELGLSVRQVFGVLRIAVTGKRVSPPLVESMAVFGKDIVVERMRRAVEVLEEGVFNH